MQTQSTKVCLRDGIMSAYRAVSNRRPADAVIATMETWSVNGAMRRHAHDVS